MRDKKFAFVIMSSLCEGILYNVQQAYFFGITMLAFTYTYTKFQLN